jgi:hypothetical protein
MYDNRRKKEANCGIQKEPTIFGIQVHVHLGRGNRLRARTFSSLAVAMDVRRIVSSRYPLFALGDMCLDEAASIILRWIKE